ncbi:MAG: hypothetical protein E7211_20270, partial [Clostridium lundense]|nr:hypothetical protein [Clostridium lundense]
MTINQTLDKLEEQLAGILPAFMMLGIAVFIVLGLGACVAPVSALSSSDIDFSSLPGFIIDTERILTASSSATFDSYYYRGTYVVDSLLVPAGTSVLSFYLTVPGTISESTLSTLSSDNPDYIFVFTLSSSDSVATVLRVYVFSLSSTTFPDDYSEWLGLELFPRNFGYDSSCLVSTPFVTLGGSAVCYNSENNVVYYDYGDYYFSTLSYPFEQTAVGSDDYVFSYSSPYIVYQGRDISSEFNSENPLQYENAVGFPVASAYYIGAAISGSTEDPQGWEEYFNDYFMGIYFDTLKSLSISYPDLIFVYSQSKWYYPRSYFSVFAFPADVLYTASESKPDEPSGEGHQFDINYNADSDTYDVSLKRNGEPWYLSIKGKAFGWLPVYTYTDVSIPSEDGKEEVFNDLSLSGLPTRFFMFDLDYHASVYRAGSGLSSNDYKGYSYYWTRSDFIGENGVVNPDPVIEPEPEEKVDFTPTVKPPFVEPGGYDMPNVGTGGGGSGGVLSSLGVPEGIEFPSIESLEQMIANMRLPASLKDMFKYPMPEDYKASYNISSTHVLYGYVNGWFTTTETTIDLVFGVVF